MSDFERNFRGVERQREKETECVSAEKNFKN